MTEFDEHILHDYLDGELAAAEVEALEAVLRDDPDLRRQLDALSEAVVLMNELPTEARVPEAVWATVQSKIGGGGPRVIPLDQKRRDSRAPTMSWSQLAAAAIVLVALTGSVTWFFAQSPPSPVAEATGEIPDVVPVAVADLSGSGELFEEYEAGTAQLEDILTQGAGVLSPETLDIIRQSLTAIDEAIEEARVALENDPGSPVLGRILKNNMKEKLELLRETAAVIQAIA